MLNSLKIAQDINAKPDGSLPKQYDPVRTEEIERKISIMFQDENFYFYDADGDNPIEEAKEVQRLIQNSIQS